MGDERWSRPHSLHRFSCQTACARRACPLRATHEKSPVLFERPRVSRPLPSALEPQGFGECFPGPQGFGESPRPTGVRGVAPARCRGRGAPMRRDTLSVSRMLLSKHAGASRRATAVSLHGVRATLSRTWTSHACQPAPGGRSYCLRVEPRRRPSARPAFMAEPAGTASAPVNRDASRRRPRPERTMGG